MANVTPTVCEPSCWRGFSKSICACVESVFVASIIKAVRSDRLLFLVKFMVRVFKLLANIFVQGSYSCHLIDQ